MCAGDYLSWRVLNKAFYGFHSEMTASSANGTAIVRHFGDSADRIELE